LKAHPRDVDGRSQPSANRAESRGHQKRASPPGAQPRNEVAEALATLKHRAQDLQERVAELRQQGVVPWERRAWFAIGSGMLIPILLVFVAPGLVRAAGTAVWLLFTGSCVSVFLLTVYRTTKMREETSNQAQAVTRADVRCGGCGLGVVGQVSPATAEQALGRAGWALSSLRCPHCRRAFV
jgi:hypothetical protein